MKIYSRSYIGTSGVGPLEMCNFKRTQTPRCVMTVHRSLAAMRVGYGNAGIFRNRIF